jgi:hypothetical protein
MMEPTKLWFEYDRAGWVGMPRYLSSSRRLFTWPKMRSIIVVVTNVLLDKAFHVQLIQNNHMLGQISSAASDPALCDTVFSRTSETGQFGLDAQRNLISVRHPFHVRHLQ